MNYLKEEKRQLHPKEKINIFSNALFLYTLKLFGKGLLKPFKAENLYQVPSKYESNKLVKYLTEQWKKQKNKKNLLFILFWRCYGIYYLLLGTVKLTVDITLLILQPYLLGKLVSYFTPYDNNKISSNQAYIYGSTLIGLSFLNCIYQHNNTLLLAGLAIKIRTALTAFMYQKVLKLKLTYIDDATIGRTVTLITKDVHAFETFIHFGNEIWICLVKSIVVITILYKRVGTATWYGTGILSIIIPLQVFGITKILNFKKEVCKRADIRYHIIQEAMSSIKTVKIYNWEDIFKNKISDARRKEVYATTNISFVRATVVPLGNLILNGALCVLLITYRNMESIVTAEVMYFIMASYRHLRFDFTITFPKALFEAAKLFVCIRRIENFLNMLETGSIQQSQSPNINNPFISVSNVTLHINSKPVLQNISLKLTKGVTLLTGSVSCGKSSLLKVILGEYSPETGSVIVNGSISYASQDPWLFPATIKQNILFGEEYDEKRYLRVLNVCSLVHDLERLEDGDLTVVEDHGINLSKGQQIRINLARAVYRKRDIYLLDNCLANLDANVSSYFYRECIEGFLRDKIVMLVSHDAVYESKVNRIFTLDHNKLTPFIKSSKTEEKDTVNRLNTYNNNSATNSCQKEIEFDENSKLIEASVPRKTIYSEKNCTKTVDIKVYKRYIQSGGGFILALVIACLWAIAYVVISYREKLMATWVNLGVKISNYSSPNSNASNFTNLIQKHDDTFRLYTTLAVLGAVFFFVQSFALFYFTRKASICLHKRMLNSILRATMEFFDVNFTGNILNRFSKDFITVDDLLPDTIFNFLTNNCKIVSTIILIVYTNRTFLVPAIIFSLIFLVLCYCYLRTARNLRRLDAATRSPVVGHINATLEGLVTIRNCQTQNVLAEELHQHLNLYTSASYTFQCCTHAFAFALDVLCSVFFTILIFRLIIVHDEKFLAGSVGLIILRGITMTKDLRQAVRSWSDVENQMTSVERVLEYVDVTPENSQGFILPNWPEQGEIKYKNVNLSYPSTNQLALKGINFTVKPGERVAIAGRTGAGKTSIISVLFRLYDFTGLITIDDVDITTLSLPFLRTHISIIPQDAVLFTGTVRDNIDPSGKLNDSDIWKIIESVSLKKTISCLNDLVVNGGSEFSPGQKQLICLARAIASNNKIVILDEPTANLDGESDILIQHAIQNNFSNSAVIIIAHNVRSIFHCSKVLMMENSEIVESGQLEELLQNKNSELYKMVETAEASEVHLSATKRSDMKTI